jgi:hypothetical protein
VWFEDIKDKLFFDLGLKMRNFVQDRSFSVNSLRDTAVNYNKAKRKVTIFNFEIRLNRNWSLFH